MWCYKFVKDAFKCGAALIGVGSDQVCRSSARGSACVFVYHRVAQIAELSGSVDSWNVSPKRFESQMRWLASHAECVPVGQLRERVAAGGSSKPLVALTFDDGFANFRHHALPVLERYGLPATVFVTTRYLGSDAPFPFDTWGKRRRMGCGDMAWRPLSWAELEACLATGLVSVGSHSHSHFTACDCQDEQLEAEATLSRELIQKRLGREQGNTYSYPYGCSRLGLVTPGYVQAVQRAGYQMALTTDLGLVRPDSSAFLLPRVEAHGWDSGPMLQGKANGHLGAFRILQKLRGQRHFGPAQFPAIGESGRGAQTENRVGLLAERNGRAKVSAEGTGVEAKHRTPHCVWGMW